MRGAVLLVEALIVFQVLAGPPATPAVPIDPISGIVDAFKSHPVVAIGDAHGNQQGEAFQLALIRDPRFASVVDDILVENGNSKYQDLLDRFVRGEDVPQEALRRVWRDTSQQQAASWDMPELLRIVREVNASLPAERRLRVLLGEPAIEWDTIRSADDFRRWESNGPDRDRFAADLIRREVLDKNRRVLALYGAGHFFRKNVTHSLVSVLEDAKATKALRSRRWRYS